MPIEVTASDSPINVSASGTKIDAAVSGGQGPQGPQGPAGPSGETLPSGTEGYVLTYVSGSWVAAAPSGGVTSWNELEDVPAAFAPSAHAASHYLGGSDVIAVDGAQVELRVAQNNQPTSLGAGTDAGAFLHRLNLNGLADAVANAPDQISYTQLTDLPTLGTAAAEDASAFAAASHQHTLADISDAGTAAGSDVGDFAAAAHAHAWSDITSGVPTTLSGYGITDAVASDDSRLTDARTPTAHKASHATGGSDALTPADIGAAEAREVRSDVSSSTNYIGVAASGSAESASAWTIYRTIYTSAGAISSRGTATGVAWNDRATASYS